jgi:hypothetical protein
MGLMVRSLGYCYGDLRAIRQLLRSKRCIVAADNCSKDGKGIGVD